MFDRTNFAAALLLLSSAVLPGCGGEQGGEARVPAQGAPEAPVPAQGAPEVPVPAQGAPEVRVPAQGAPEAPVPAQGAPEAPVPAQGAPEVRVPTQGAPEVQAPTQGAPEVGVPTQGAPAVGVPAQSAPEVRVPTQSAPVVRVFKHPGAPLTLSDLKTLKAYIDQGKEPWKSAYDQLANDGKAKLTYGMGGPYATVSRAPDLNLWAWRNDMAAIWNLSRMWYFTGNQEYARKARAILMAWATTHVEFSGRESMLDLGDYAYLFVGGADILRGTWPGWTEGDTATVKKYFKEVLMPASNPYGENQFGAANKGALALTALGLMAIFNDDTEMLDKVAFKTRTLAHIGLRSSNDIGMLGDYLRDQGHAHGQLKSLVMLAEALWKQGIDVYSDFDDRLLAAGE